MRRTFAAVFLVLLTMTAPALAQGEVPPETKVVLDTLWVLIAAMLVFFMNAGFATLEVGPFLPMCDW